MCHEFYSSNIQGCGNGGSKYVCALGSYKSGTVCSGTGFLDTQLCQGKLLIMVFVLNYHSQLAETEVVVATHVPLEVIRQVQRVMELDCLTLKVANVGLVFHPFSLMILL